MAKYWKSLKFDCFEQTPLPTGKQLLHCLFKDNWGNRYKWTPPWKDMEEIFFKSLEIEERNEPQGVWDEELRRVAQKIPSLKAFKLPVEIGCLHVRDLERSYCITVKVLGEEKVVSMNYSDPRCDSFKVGASEIKFLPLVDRILDLDRSSGRKYGIDVDHKSLSTVSGAKSGICFDIQLSKGLEATAYEAAAREINVVIRSYLRDELACFRAIEEGFEDGQYEGGGYTRVLTSKKKNLSAMIDEWIPTTLGRWFEGLYCDEVLDITSSRDKRNRRQIFFRLCNAGVLERHPTKKGVYRLRAGKATSSWLSK